MKLFTVRTSDEVEDCEIQDTIEINSIQDIIDLISKEDEDVVVRRKWDKDYENPTGEFVLEIYDDCREG